MKMQAISMPINPSYRHYYQNQLSSRNSVSVSNRLQGQFRPQDVRFGSKGWIGPSILLGMSLLSALFGAKTFVENSMYNHQPQIAIVNQATSKLQQAQLKLSNDLALYKYQHSDIDKMLKDHGYYPSEYHNYDGQNYDGNGNGIDNSFGGTIDQQTVDHAAPVTMDQLQQDLEQYLKASESAFASGNGDALLTHYFQQTNVSSDDITAINQILANIMSGSQLSVEPEGKNGVDVAFLYHNPTVSNLTQVSDQYIDILATHLPDTPDKAAKVQQMKELARNYIAQSKAIDSQNKNAELIIIGAAMAALIFVWIGGLSLHEYLKYGY